MRISKDENIENGLMEADIDGPVHEIEHQWLACVQAVWTGATAEGTLTLQGSINKVNWENLTDYSKSISGDGSVLWDIPNTGIPYIRVHYAFTAGTGNLNTWIAGKGV